MVAICLVPLAGLFGAMDAALQRVGKARVDELRREGAPRAAGLEAVLDDRARWCHLLLLLRIVCELVATVLVTVALFSRVGRHLAHGARRRRGDDRGQLRAGRRRAAHARPPARLRRSRCRSAGLVRLLGRVLGPLATLLILIGNAITPGRGFRDGPFSSEVELRELVDMAEERGVVEHGEREMIQSVFELGDTIAREVMVPRTEVVWIERGKTLRQALALALRSGFSRIPVIGENVDDVIGVVYLKDLVRRAQDRTTASADRGSRR